MYQNLQGKPKVKVKNQAKGKVSLSERNVSIGKRNITESAVDNQVDYKRIENMFQSDKQGDEVDVISKSDTHPTPSNEIEIDIASNSSESIQL